MSIFVSEVMTTVGYGNQAPVTVGGRVMIFTLGFLSILLFGSILAAAGTIISHLVHDFVVRSKIRCLTNKFIMMLIWGSLWVAWMVLLSNYMIEVSRFRWGPDSVLSWGDGMWFAYISTTTVGLGGKYCEWHCEQFLETKF